MSNYDLDESPTFICDHGQESFTSKRNMAHHINGLHRNQKCTKKTFGYKTLSKDMVTKKNCKISKKRLLFHCDLCQTSYFTKRQKKLHIIQDHQGLTNKNSPRVHTDKKSCKKTCFKKGQLTKQKRLHTNENPYKCEL